MKQFIYLASTFLLAQALPQGWNSSPPAGWSSSPPEGWSSNPPPGWSASPPSGWSGSPSSGWSGAANSEGEYAASGSTLIFSGIAGNNTVENPMFVNATNDYGTMEMAVSNYQDADMESEHYTDYVNSSVPNAGAAGTYGPEQYTDTYTIHYSGINVTGLSAATYSQDPLDYTLESQGALAESSFSYVTNGTNIANTGTGSGWGSGSGWKKED